MNRISDKSRLLSVVVAASRDRTKQFRNFLSPTVLTCRQVCSHHWQDWCLVLSVSMAWTRQYRRSITNVVSMRTLSHRILYTVQTLYSPCYNLANTVLLLSTNRIGGQTATVDWTSVTRTIQTMYPVYNRSESFGPGYQWGYSVNV